MSISSITMIVPELPPAVNGLGDYSLQLAKQLTRDFGYKIDFIVGNPHWKNGELLEGFEVRQVKARDEKSLLELLPNSKGHLVLLHYVGYGYAKRGCPAWLVKGLEFWKRKEPEQKLVTMFHEIYAFGPIWTSQFWTSHLQRNLASRLISLSTKLITSKEGYADMLRRFGAKPSQAIKTMPIYSSVGEMEQLPVFSSRKKQMIIFGGTHWRAKAYSDYLGLIEKVCLELKIEEVIDIGAPLSQEINFSNDAQLKFTSLGVKSAADVDLLMKQALVGFLVYPADYLAKSSIFAGYTAHGLVPVIADTKLTSQDGLLAHQNYWPVFEGQVALSELMASAISQNAHSWYQKHNLKENAAVYNSLF